MRAACGHNFIGACSRAMKVTEAMRRSGASASRSWSVQMLSDITRDGGAAAAVPDTRTAAAIAAILKLRLHTDIEGPLRRQEPDRILIGFIEQIFAPGEKGEHRRHLPARRQVERDLAIGLEA